ncbi:MULTISPECIES: acyltransferase family protein [Bacillus]|uniref:Acyltransferase 3 domain-containing protein n=2 Tax=Bacillus TaxID=1386 RepID=A0A0M4FIF0_9BACI|nr:MULTISPECIES: acyltransferase [Bacillus]ALC82687.1 hypothetical protein AM592_14690 [Bacillus gobiensis]MBP1081635.1 peptidoglycan/LPS O-acetylase OafA/YrhL [Bacillus capparidis]MED1096290.1 acyltransferase [Bacillus capparidis]
MKPIDTKFLDGTRLLLALWVAVGHFYTYTGGKELISVPLISDILLSAGPAVDGFMIITGFLMMYHYLLKEKKEPPSDKTTIFKFWLKRLVRLYPIYFVAILAAFVLFKTNFQYVHSNYSFFTGKEASFGTTFNSAAIPGMSDLFSHLTFLHGLIPGQNTSLLGPAWSLSLEMQFYLVFPILFLIFFRNEALINKTLLLFTGASFVIGFLAPKLFGSWDSSGILADFGAPSLIVFKLHFFVLGMIMACVALKRASRFHLGMWILLVLPFQGRWTILVTIGIITLMFSDDVKRLVHPRVNSVLYIIKQCLSNKAAKIGADISYSLYLTHMIIIPIVVNAVISYTDLGVIQTAAVSLLAFLVINILVSLILFKVVEETGIKFGRVLIGKIFSKRTNEIPVKREV